MISIVFWGFASGDNPYFLSNIQNFFFVLFFDKINLEIVLLKVY